MLRSGRVTALSVSAIAAAVVVLALTRPGGEPAATEVAASPAAALMTATVVPGARLVARSEPPVKRAEVFVEIYNNTNVRGLAGRTAEQAATRGWNVVGSDNWYGTIEATTVYYPARLQRAARQMGRDLGIARLRPAVAPMRMDRLTVILAPDRR